MMKKLIFCLFISMSLSAMAQKSENLNSLMQEELRILVDGLGASPVQIYEMANIISPRNESMRTHLETAEQLELRKALAGEMDDATQQWFDSEIGKSRLHAANIWEEAAGNMVAVFNSSQLTKYTEEIKPAIEQLYGIGNK